MNLRTTVRRGNYVAAAAVILTAIAACSAPAAQPVPHGDSTQAAPIAPPAAAAIANSMHLSAIVVITAASDPNHLLGRQGGYTSDVDAGPTYSPGDTGSIGIEVYPDAAGAARRVSYLRAFAGTVFGDGYDYQAATAVLRLDRHYTPEQAQALAATFRKAAR